LSIAAGLHGRADEYERIAVVVKRSLKSSRCSNRRCRKLPHIVSLQWLLRNRDRPRAVGRDQER
jgi:hypothetical protein